YKLIHFVEGYENEQRCIDIVPSSWITYDVVSDHLMTIFMPLPYTTESTEILHCLVKSKSNPPTSWPSYKVNLVGDAKNYKSAVNKLKLLNSKEYAYSTSSDHGKIRSLADKKSYKLKAVKPTNKDHEKKLLNVPSLDSESDNDNNDCSKVTDCKCY
ncbi:hypothetical protein ALC57_14492, partial [Trachymyrmex cornetzi]